MNPGPKAPPAPPPLLNRFAPKDVDPLAPAPDGLKFSDGVKGGLPPKLSGAPLGDIIDARKGLAAPPPVIWGRRPCPRVELLFPKFGADVGNMVCVAPPNGCELDPKEPPYKPPLSGGAVPLTVEPGLPEMAGVVGEEPGIGGRDSISEAPKDDDGLNGLRPANPVK